MAKSYNTERRWSIPSKRAKSYAEERKAKVHQHGEKEGKELTDYEIKDDRGHVLKGNTYAVVSVDENGIDYECAIKPFRKSDQSLMNMLLR